MTWTLLSRGRTTTRRTRRGTLVALIGIVSLLAMACDPNLPALGGPAADAAAERPAIPTEVEPNRSPRIVGPERIEALVGETRTAEIATIDPDGDRVSLRFGPLAPGLSVTGPMVSFSPPAPGTWDLDVGATDAHGAEATRTVQLVARFRAQPLTIVALGDSVASGHGLDLVDYLGGDGCWRSAGSYPYRVLDILRDQGTADRLVHAACSGHRTRDLGAAPVTDGAARTPQGTAPVRRTPADWAVLTNPGSILVTVGANDIGFNRPHDLLRDGILDTGTIDGYLATFEQDLDALVDQLVDQTDSTIVLTTYYNPTAETPNGVEGCTGDCFVTAAAQVVGRLNGTIVDVAARHPATRVRIADPSAAFDTHRAPNGLGPDSIRDGDGILGDILGGYTRGVHPYCSEPQTDHDSWINAVDCVHPNRAGAVAYASTIADVLGS